VVVLAGTVTADSIMRRTPSSDEGPAIRGDGVHDLIDITCEHLATMAAPVDEAGARTYGPSRAVVLGLRRFVGLLTIGAVQVFGAIERDRVSVLSGVVFYVAINAVAFLGFAVLLRPRIIVSDNGVTIVNASGCGTRRVGRTGSCRT
jgi:hypothetical protein